jgi:hypothetical protein
VRGFEVKLYSIEALADAKISKLDAILHGRYLDFNISVLNKFMYLLDFNKYVLFKDVLFVLFFIYLSHEIGQFVSSIHILISKPFLFHQEFHLIFFHLMFFQFLF